ncbi:PR domain zinc finger protein 5-like [Teleopsis dalmanni]|uniref:PR domain zinc finger protein 5-like n=1 Tax=Teleopsis dalmanni TaxID=139649 RepID=UPI0018CF0344|nr:PR domain zinc finger protein 5-like [Teleopsis dalmanni]
MDAINKYDSDGVIEYCPEDFIECEIEEEVPVIKTEHSRFAETFQCSKCPYQDSSLDQVRTHYYVVHEGWPLVTLAQEEEETDTNIVFVCSLCFRQYSLEEDLRGHMIEYHKCVPIEETDGKTVDVAEIVDKQISEFKELLDTHKTIPQIEQEVRPMAFKDFRLFLRVNLKIRCTFTTPCMFKFENLARLETHLKCHADNLSQKFKCLECGLEILNWRRCSAHLWKVHQIDVDLLQCPSCEFRAPASVLVWRHMRVHRKWRSRVIRSLRAVKEKRLQNVEKLPEVKPITPPNKNKYYSEKICEICNRKFVNGKTLSKHVKTVHNKIKPFICNVCGKKTARKASLIIHMRQHTGEKPLQCKTCKFSSRDPSVLHKHQLRHEKVGKFKCNLCDYSCIQTNSYKRHIRTNHPEVYKRIACDICNFVTITEQKLLAHKEDHKKGLIVNYEDSMDATRNNCFKNPGKLHDKTNEIILREQTAI